MEVWWSPEAADDLERIVIRVLDDNRQAVRRIADTIYQRVPTCNYSPISLVRAG